MHLLFQSLYFAAIAWQMKQEQFFDAFSYVSVSINFVNFSDCITFLNEILDGCRFLTLRATTFEQNQESL